MSLHAVHGDRQVLWSSPQRISELISQYPRLSGDEVHEVQNFIRTGRYLDILLLTSNDKLRPKIDAFMDEHGDLFSRQPDVAAVAGTIILASFVLWAIWTAVVL